MKTEPVNDHFIPSEHKAPKCVTVGFDDDGRDWSSVPLRAFLGVVSRPLIHRLTVEPLGLL